jgi:hypothetical protein
MTDGSKSQTSAAFGLRASAFVKLRRDKPASQGGQKGKRKDLALKSLKIRTMKGEAETFLEIGSPYFVKRGQGRF